MLLQICLIVLIPFFCVMLIFKLNQLFHWNWFENAMVKVDRLLTKRRSRKNSFLLLLSLIKTSTGYFLIDTS